ncbi:replication-associated recombination protein A [Clostridium sp. cel8]|uniref:replication-associated recombination protein A n=1 Tax=Clostridium sp. cel8 TaxID=2663123 RepID=UPI0015F56654|nr:replication-associated recombination protein A [Clostridium sp. cel8]MBA5851146.1 replication-associated recombination protein A [Clostridium sp. cel8]
MDYVQSSMFDRNVSSPLAERMRPTNLDDYIGQEHILGKGKMLRNLIYSDNIGSMIFWGPPGVGKTTLAKIIASITKANFITFSAVSSGIKEIKEVMAEAKRNRTMGIRTIVFVDEIHRFNKAQQDAFLPHVEKGNIILIGATTENPSFQVNSALLSRCKVFTLKPLSREDIVTLLKRAIEDDKGFGYLKINIEEDVIDLIATYSNGDGRTALNTLEMAVMSSVDGSNSANLTRNIVKQCIGKKTLLYDKSGEEHYNLISAFHKSMRNSDVDASVYWLTRMLESGEDPLYIARRMVRFASEDIGMADSLALQVAVSAYSAVQFIGMPECGVNLAHAAVYMATAPKSNAVYMSYNNAKKDAENTISEPVPLHLRNAPTKLMKDLGYHKNYKYSHDFKGKVADMQCLPDNLKDRQYYIPTEEGFEKQIKERLAYINNLKKKS